MSYTYPYPAHYVTTDIVVFSFKDAQLQVLLVERGNPPFKGAWALPGGFLRPDEELDACARRELAEETSLAEFFLEPFTTVGTVGRDPRGRVITVGYLALMRWAADIKAGSDAHAIAWHPADHLPEVAFDHEDLIKAARVRMEQMLGARPMLLLKFLPEEFSVEEMQRLQDAVIGKGRRALYRRATDLKIGQMTVEPRKR
jgi:8-oxo-dGTP diphosphatase